jgi:hypothetical protein
LTSSLKSLLVTDRGAIRRMAGHTINLVAVAANRWCIAETISTVVIGHGEIAAPSDGNVSTTPTGYQSRGAMRPELLKHHLHSAA